MSILAQADCPVIVPAFVDNVLRRSSDDLRWLVTLIRDAGDVEWVSDAAALYLDRLDRVRRLVQNVGARLTEADTAVSILSRTP